MNHPFIYVGCFVEFEDFQSAIKCIREDPLENDIQYPHITFAYEPKEVDESLFGEKIYIKIVGYGNNGLNEGLKVCLKTDNPTIQSMIDHIEVPHITIAVSNEGRPVNTKGLVFENIDPIEMEGEYGGYAKWGRVILGDGNNKCK